MNDPFETLTIFDEFDASSISFAFAGAVARGVALTDARAAMDALRDPVERSAAEILAPSMSQAARRLRSAGVPDETDPAIGIVLRALAYAADAIDRDLASTARRPSRADLVDQVLSPLPDHLSP
jgi:hypothetical protein